jgi:small subunit ribosomal protein S17e
MGTIKPTYIKRVAHQLTKEHPELFDADFEHNKLMVNRVTDVKSIGIRNKIAGYVTRTRKRQIAHPL